MIITLSELPNWAIFSFKLVNHVLCHEFCCKKWDVHMETEIEFDYVTLTFQFERYWK